MLFVPFIYILVHLTFCSTTPVKENKDSPEYVRQNGQISVNDSEIIILINSTYEIIEDFERNSTEFESVLENSTTATTPAEPISRKPIIRFHKLGAVSTSSSCRQYTQHEKYEMLEEVGSRNQLFMADTPEEASRGFASAYPEPTFEAKARPFAADVETEIDPNYCDARCEMIKKTLTDAQQKQSQRSRAKDVPFVGKDAGEPMNDAEGVEVDEGIPFVGGCFLESFIPIGNCTELGEDASWTHEKLCSECRGIYMLNQNCFPAFFNTVRCNTQEMGCIFDTFSHKAHGECQAENLSFKVLRNRGDSQCEDWVYEEILLPVACQCMLSKNSFLRARPPGEL